MPCDALFVHEPDGIITANLYKQGGTDYADFSTPGTTGVTWTLELNYDGAEAKTLEEGDVLVTVAQLHITSSTYTITPPSGWEEVLNVRTVDGTAVYCAAYVVQPGDTDTDTYTFTADPCTHVNVQQTPVLRSVDTDQATWFDAQSEIVTPTASGFYATGSHTFDVGDFTGWTVDDGDALLAGSGCKSINSNAEDINPPFVICVDAHDTDPGQPGWSIWDSTADNPCHFGHVVDLPNNPTLYLEATSYNVGTPKQIHFAVAFRPKCAPSGWRIGTVAW